MLSYAPANEIEPSGSGVDGSRDCIHMVPCFNKQFAGRPLWFGSDSCKLLIDIDS